MSVIRKTQIGRTFQALRYIGKMPIKGLIYYILHSNLEGIIPEFCGHWELQLHAVRFACKNSDEKTGPFQYGIQTGQHICGLLGGEKLRRTFDRCLKLEILLQVCN